MILVAVKKNLTRKVITFLNLYLFLAKVSASHAHKKTFWYLIGANYRGYCNVVPRISPLPSHSHQETGRRETLGTRLCHCFNVFNEHHVTFIHMTVTQKVTVNHSGPINNWLMLSVRTSSYALVN